MIVVNKLLLVDLAVLVEIELVDRRLSERAHINLLENKRKTNSLINGADVLPCVLLEAVANLFGDVSEVAYGSILSVIVLAKSSNLRSPWPVVAAEGLKFSKSKPSARMATFSS